MQYKVQNGQANRKKIQRTAWLLISLLSVIPAGIANADESSDKTIPFDRIVVDRHGPQNPWIKILADLDGDGKQDIVIGGQKGPLVWYRYPDWKKSLIVTGGYNTVDGEAGDIDRDGDLDIVVGGLFWYENPGKQDGEDKGWKANRIAQHPTHDVELGDLDGDGDLDIATRDQSAFGQPKGQRIHLWYQEAAGRWKEQVLQCPNGEGIDLADIDRDGDSDVVINGLWFENPGKTGKWISHTYAEWHPNSTVSCADINGDGRLDVVLSPAELKQQFYRLSWFEVPDNVKKSPWTEHTIVKKIECVIHGLQTADIDGNGSMDVVYSEMHQGEDPDEVVIMYNEANGNGWRKQVISVKGSHYIQAADVDGDGDVDLMGANWSSGFQPVELWINKRIP